MTNHPVRIYTSLATLLVFFLLWTTVAAHPWAAASENAAAQDPRLHALALREKRLQARAAVVKRIVDRRWAVYSARAAERQRANAAALQQYIVDLQASQAAAVQASRVAAAQTAQARRYAASVVAWANQQLAAGGTEGSAAVVSTAAPATSGSAAPKATAAVTSRTRPSGSAAATPAPKAPGASTPPPAPSAPAAADPTPTPSAAQAPAAAAAPAPAPAPAPAAAAPPVQVVQLPPVTTTKTSAKKK